MLFSLGITPFAKDGIVKADKTQKYNIKAYSKALTLMQELKKEIVLTDTPEKLLTRAEFVAAVTEIFETDKFEGESVYSDVAKEHKYICEISTACNLGWIDKTERFYPDNEITLVQALKILLTAAEYGTIAKAKGGFPSGYLSIAYSLDLLDGVNSQDGALLSTADATILFYNFMFAPVLEIASVGEGVNFEQSKEIYLEKIYDAYSIEGVLTATEHNSILLDAPFEKDNGKIQIDGIEYKYDNADINLLGKNVVAYCSKSDSTLKKVYCLMEERNNEKVISIGDYENISGDYISYIEDSKLRKERLESAYKVIYNGRRVAAIEDYMLNDNGGTIRLLSNNGDNKYEFIFIDSYSYGIITSIDYVNGYVGYKTADYAGAFLDITDDKEHASYFRDGKGNKLEIYELSKDMAVALKTSADNRIYDVTVLPDTLIGTVTGMCIEEDTIDVDNVSYKVSEKFKESYLARSIININDKINAIIGMHGELIYLISSSKDFQYGLLLKVAKDGALNSKIYIKVLTESCKFEDFQLAEKVTIDGERKKKDDEAYADVSAKLSEAENDTANPMVVIKYALDNDGLISMLDFASNDISNFGKNLNAKNSLTRYIKNNPSSPVYYRNGGFASKVMVKTSTIVFVPKSIDERDEEDNYTISDYSLLSSNVSKYEIDAYDVDETGNAAFVVVYMADTENKRMAAYTNSYMIEKVSRYSNDEEEGYKITAWSNNAFETLLMPDSVTVDKTSGSKELVAGDIVRFTVLDGKVKKVYVDYDFSSGVHVSDTRGGASFTTINAQHYLSFVSGKVYNVGTNTIVISDAADNEGNVSFEFGDLRPYSINNTVACFDTETKEIRTIKLENIHTYKGHGQNADIIFLRSDFDNPKCAFVIR